MKSTVLKYRYYGPIEGRVIGIDKSAFGAMRLTLDRVSLRKKKSKLRASGRIRVSLHGPLLGISSTPGDIIGTTGSILPPLS